MTRIKALSLMAALTAGCATNQSVEDDDRDDNREDREQTVSIDQLPPAARATLMKEAGGGTIDEIDKEQDDGRVTYEADVLLDGKKWEIAVAADGKLIGKALDEETDGEDNDDDEDGEEVAVSIDQLPPAARATLMKEAGGGKIEEIDKEKSDGRWVYCADVIINGKKWEIEVGEDGKLIEKELDTETDGEDDKDD